MVLRKRRNLDGVATSHVRPQRRHRYEAASTAAHARQVAALNQPPDGRPRHSKDVTRLVNGESTLAIPQSYEIRLIVSSVSHLIADLKVRATYVNCGSAAHGAMPTVRGENPPRHAAHAKPDKSPDARLRPTTTATSVRGHRAVVVFSVREQTSVRWRDLVGMPRRVSRREGSASQTPARLSRPTPSPSPRRDLRSTPAARTSRARLAYSAASAASTSSTAR
jgi:hypothetical protein